MVSIATQIVEATKVGRTHRKPEHTFSLRTRPWQIQPFLLAPVLPGETMKNALLQSRVVTDPIKNPLIGWHTEYYFYYVKLRDLDDRDSILPMFVEPGYSTASLNSWPEVAMYHADGSINWARKCLARVVDEYFRDEGEAWDSFHLDDIPIAHVNRSTWMQSMVLKSEVSELDVLPGEDVENENTVTGFDPHYVAWEHLKAAGMTDLTYEDYLKSYGIRGKAVEQIIDDHKPELLRYVREWSYPSNTVNPVDGSPSSAVSWSVVENASKDRFFKEPGFIFGVTVARPKVYFKNQQGSLADFMGTPFDWLPAVLRGQDHTSLKLFDDATASPLGTTGSAGGFWADVKDLFMYGDQFINFALTETDAGLVALPNLETMQRRYASTYDADALFKDHTRNKIRQDGVVMLDILGALKDTTP